MNVTLLIAEDEPAIREGLVDAFTHAGYQVVEAENGPQALERAQSERPALVLLDVMMPGFSGFEVCRRLRGGGFLAPIIMLTAKGAEEDILKGLEAGADDYVTKPFSVKELLARVSAQVRRSTLAFATRLDLGAVRVDLERSEADRDGQREPLTRRECDLIRYFTAHAGKVVSRADLLRDVWGYGNAELETRTVDIHMAKLRRKIESQPATPRLIITVRDQGYRWDGPGAA